MVRLSRRAEAQARAARRLAVIYDAVVVPAALLVAGSGAALIALVHGPAVLGLPWVAAMAGLFALEFVEGNTITRLFFRRLARRATQAAHEGRRLDSASLPGGRLAAFTHFLDLPMVGVIVWLGIARPLEWGAVMVAIALAVGGAAALSLTVPAWTARLTTRGAPSAP
jgi:hypothetical protein